MYRQGAAAMALLALLAGCAGVPQQETGPPDRVRAGVAQPDPVVLGGLLGGQVRLFRVAYPLLQAARDLCGTDTSVGIGLYAANRHALGRLANSEGAEAVGHEMRVLSSVPGGPAHAAGIRAGDYVVSVNGRDTPTDAEATKVYSTFLATAVRGPQPLSFVLRRGGDTVVAAVKPEVICSYVLFAIDRSQVQAISDGKTAIVVTQGMLEFAGSDQELAFVVAHEIAHNAMGHRETVLRLLSDTTGARGQGANGMSTEQSYAFESQADYVGLYIMARAGIPLESAPRYLQRSAARTGDRPSLSHPSSAARLAAIRQTIQEIERKRATGAPLTPVIR